MANEIKAFDGQTDGASPFDGIRLTDAVGEYWSTRDLGEQLDYSDWMQGNSNVPRDQDETSRSCSSGTTREDFLSRYETVSHFDSECLVGIGVTRQILAACEYCFDVDDLGIPQWNGRMWVGLHRLVMTGGEVVS